MRFTVNKEYRATEDGVLPYQSTWREDLERYDGNRVSVVLDDGTRIVGAIDASQSDHADLVLNTGGWASEGEPIHPRQFAVRTGSIKSVTVKR